MEQEMTGDKFKAPFEQSLNGTWRFKFGVNPSERPLDFYKPTYCDNGWNDIKVPSN